MCLAEFHCPKINMKILMSGFHELRYLDLFEQTAEIFFKAPIEQRQTTDGKMITAHWGITWSEDYIYATHNIFEEGKIKQLIINFDKDKKFLGVLPIPTDLFSRGHQIQYYEGYIYVTDTGRNCIQRINCDTLKSQRIIPNAEKFGSDIDHINSLFVNNNKLYVGCLEGTVYVYNLDTLGLMCEYEFPKELHNLFILDDELLSNYSSEGMIVNSIGRPFFKVGTYNRGVVITDEYLLVGQSAVLEAERRGGDRPGYITIFNRFTKEKIGKIELPGMGQLMEMRCLDQKDYAHYGRPFVSD